jgi:hypothetical protein
MIATTAVYPLEIIKTNLQAQKKRTTPGARPPRTVAEIVRDVVARDGLIGLYGGCQVAACQAFLEKFIYFFTFETLKRTYTRLVGPASLPTSVLLGYFSDWSHLPITMPAEQVAVRIQTTGASALNALRQLREENGLRGLYKGLGAYVVLGLKPAVQNAVFEALKARVLKRVGAAAKELSALQAFCLGAIARAIATLLVFPCTRAKVLMMTRGQDASQPAGAHPNDKQQPRAPGLREVLSQVVREEGVLALYQGVKPELIRGVLSAAVMLMAKEKITASNRRHFAAALSRRAPSTWS